MRKRELYLTAVLLILIGVSLGTVIALYSISPEFSPLREVNITEVKRTENPLFHAEQRKSVLKNQCR